MANYAVRTAAGQIRAEMPASEAMQMIDKIRGEFRQYKTNNGVKVFFTVTGDGGCVEHHGVKVHFWDGDYFEPRV